MNGLRTRLFENNPGGRDQEWRFCQQPHRYDAIDDNGLQSNVAVSGAGIIAPERRISPSQGIIAITSGAVVRDGAPLAPARACHRGNTGGSRTPPLQDLIPEIAAAQNLAKGALKSGIAGGSHRAKNVGERS